MATSISTIIGANLPTGPQGVQGVQGILGATAGFLYTFSSTTTAADPGSGFFRFNSGTAGSITEMYISETDNSATNRSAPILLLDDVGGTGRATIFLPGVGTGYTVSLTITGDITDNGTWLTIPVTFDSGALPTNGDIRSFISVRYGAQGAQGIQGTQGSQGAQGIQGRQGPQGIDGSQGAQGIQGRQGPQGIQGHQGPQGIQGNQGPQGITGAGIQGPQGIQGNQGNQGPQGITGAGIQGPQGIQGSQGPQGIQGQQGPQGIQGNQGPQGITGAGTQGPQGIQGQQGPQGIQGNQGPQGITGNQGPQGIQGQQGSQGIQGSQGPQGIQGQQGPQGIQGNQGPQGIQGSQGPQGITGNQGAQGIQGTGNQGVQGIIGSASTVQGPQGPSGSGSGSGSGNANVSVTSTAPGSGTANNDFWWDTNSGKLKIYYNDGTSTAWVDAFVAAQGPTGPQGVQGITGSGAQGAQGISGSLVAGGSTNQIQYNNAGTLAGDSTLVFYSANDTVHTANVVITGNIISTSNSTGSLVVKGGVGIDGDIYMQGSSPYINFEGITTEPTVPAANNLLLYAKNIGGRMLPKFVGPSGFDTAVQPLLATNRFAIWNPPQGIVTAPGTTIGVSGLALSTIGTLTARTLATTNMFTRMKRLGLQTTGTGNNLNVSAYVANTAYTIGTGTTPALGGFYFVARFGDQDAVAATRFFAGMSSTVTSYFVGEPSTLTNSIGIGYGTADTNYKIFYGGSAAQTPIDLGSSFQCKLANTTPMELIMFAPSDSSTTVYYRVTVLNTGNTASGTLTAATIGTQLPANSTLLAPRLTKNNVTSGAVSGFDVISLYIESDY